MRQINCREIVPFLAPYHDRELDPITRTIVDAHLAGCKQCRTELVALEAVDHAVGSWATATVAAANPLVVAGVARGLADAAIAIHGVPARSTAAVLIATRARQTAKAAGLGAIRLAGSSGRGTVRVGGVLIRGTRRAASSLTLGRQRAARTADGIVAATVWVRRITTATAQRFGRGVPALG